MIPLSGCDRRTALLPPRASKASPSPPHPTRHPGSRSAAQAIRDLATDDGAGGKVPALRTRMLGMRTSVGMTGGVASTAKRSRYAGNPNRGMPI